MSREQYNDLGHSTNSKRRVKKNPLGIILLIILVISAFLLYMYFANKDRVINTDKKEEKVKVVKQEVQDTEVVQTQITVIKPKAKEEEKSDKIDFFDYYLKEEDNEYTVASRFNLSVNTILSLNKDADFNIPNTPLRISDRDGILYEVNKNDILVHLLTKYSPQLTLKEYLKLTGRSSSTILAGEQLFFPTIVKERLTLYKPLDGSFSYLNSNRYLFKIKNSPMVYAPIKGKVRSITLNDKKQKELILDYNNGEIILSNFLNIKVRPNEEVDEKTLLGSASKEGLLIQIKPLDLEIIFKSEI